jgi:hypothetical protein
MTLPHTTSFDMANTFLSKARALTQWHDNQQILAPNERTPYLDKAAMAAVLLLADAMPEASAMLVKCGARAAPGRTTVPGRVTREWLLRLDGRLLDMEGETTAEQAIRAVTGRWNIGMYDITPGNYDVVATTHFLNRDQARDKLIVGGYRVGQTSCVASRTAG